jgi:predicted kinase
VTDTATWTDAIDLLDDGIRIIDALEFSVRLRNCDVASEIAFLAMDLDRLGKPDYAEELACTYVEATGDADINILMQFYKCHRAIVRAKVGLIRSRQSKFDPVELESANHYLELAQGYAQRPAPRSLIAVCGSSGSGKSTMARTLQEEIRFEILSSDAERKRLAGATATERSAATYGEGIYTEERTRDVYRSLIAKAEGILRSNAGVIIDATFQRRDQRDMLLDMVTRVGVAPIFVECRAEKHEVIRRLTRRSHDANEISDATVETYLEQSKEFEPLSEIPPIWRIVSETGTARSHQSTLLAVERHIFSRN